jgi:hypothetical protein
MTHAERVAFGVLDRIEVKIHIERRPAQVIRAGSSNLEHIAKSRVAEPREIPVGKKKFFLVEE